MTTVVSGASDLLLGWGAEADAVAVVGNGIVRGRRAARARRTRWSTPAR
jgi:hypothetical protein